MFVQIQHNVYAQAAPLLYSAFMFKALFIPLEGVVSRGVISEVDCMYVHTVNVTYNAMYIVHTVNVTYNASC